MSASKLYFHPAATLPQIIFYILIFYLPRRAVFHCTFFSILLDHPRQTLYILFVTIKKRERTAPTKVRSFSQPIQALYTGFRIYVLLRLPVNQQSARLHFYDKKKLTLLQDNSYKNFIKIFIPYFHGLVSC